MTLPDGRQMAGERMAAAMCPARLHVVEGGGHMLLGQLDQT